MIDQQLDKLQDPSRDVISMDEWRMMADHMGGVEMMGGRATELVRAVQAPTAPLRADSGHMDHDKEQMDAKPGTPERPRKPAPRDSVPHHH